MRKIFKTQEIFDKEPEIIKKGKTMLKEPGVKQRKRGIGEIPKTPKPLDTKSLTLVSLPTGTELEILDDKIEETYTEYLKLQTKIEGFDTSLSEIPNLMKPTVVANYNKMIKKHNSLLSELQTNIAKRNQIVSIQESVQKKQEFIQRKHLEGREVSTQKTTRHPGLQSSSILDKPSAMGGALGISQPLDLDKINKYVAAPLKGVKHGIYATPQAVGGLMRLLGENMQATKGTQNIFTGDDKKYKDLIDKKMQKPETRLDQLMIDKSQEIIKDNRAYLLNIGLHPDLDDKTAAWLFQLGSGATSLVGAVGIALLTHSPHAAAVAFGMYQTGSMYQEAREADVKVGKATGLAITAGAIEGALEYIGLQWLFTRFGGNFFVDRLLHAGLEGFQEFSQQLGENLVAMIGWDETRNLFEGAAESASIGAVLGGGASAITANIEDNTDLKGLTDKEKKGLIKAIVEKQSIAMNEILSNLSPRKIIETLQDPDIQKSILGVFEAEQEVVTEAYKAEPKEPTIPEELEAKREVLREHGVKEDLLTDEFVKKAKIIELPKADVTSEIVSEGLIEKLEKKWGKKTELTKEEVLEKVEKPPKVEPKAPGEIEVGKKAKGKVKISHLSTEKKLKTVDPEFMGKGEAGREMARVGEKGFEKTSAWYTEETPNIEARFKHGMMLYTTEIDAKDIYDRKADPENLDTHTKIKEAGYKGYKIDDQIRLFEEVAVTSEGTPRAKLGEKVSIKDIKTFIKSPIRVKEASQTIGQLHKDNEGSSFSLYEGDLSGQPFFVVSTHPEINVTIPGKNLTNTQIADFIEKNMDLLKDPKNFVGTWYNEDSGNSELDVSEAIESKEEAIKLGEKYEQEEIWDLKKGEGIPIKPPVPPKKTTFEQPEPEFDKDIKIGDVYTIGEKTPAKKVKGKVREITGQTKKDKILIAELDILDLVLKGQEKAARKAFSEGKKEGIFKQKEHFKDIVNRAKERKAQKEYINKLIKDINKLPTANIVVDYKDKIEAIKSVFDLRKRQRKTLHAREETVKFIEKEMEKGDTVLDIPQKTLDIIKTIPLNDMTITQLETVHDSIIHLAKIGKLKGKMIKVQKGKETEELARDLIATLYENKVNKISQEKYKLDFKELNRTQKQDVVEEFQKRTRNIKQEIRDITGLKKKISDPWNHYWVNSTLDESLFEKMDGEERGLWWEVFYNTINKCTNTELLNTFDKIEKVRNLFDDNKIDINKFLEERTGDLMLTHSQRTGLYLCSLDEDAKKHIQKAGVIIKKGLEPYQFTDSDIKDVVDSLTKEEKAVAKFYQEYQLTQEKELDEFDVRVRGVHLKGVKNRFAIQVQGEDLYNSVAVELERNPLTRRAYMEEGFRKPRAHTGEGIIMLDCVTNMMRDITKVEHYKAYKEAEMDINNLLSNPELKKAILGNPKYGRAAYDNITQWFKDSVQAKQNKILSTSDKTFMFLRTSAFISMLGFNVLSGTKQLVSLCNAVGLVGLPAVLSGIEQVSLHYNETKQFVFKRDPQARARKGMIDKVMQEWMESADAKAVLKNQTKDWRMKTLFLIRMLDEYAVLSVWKGTYDSVISSQKINGKPIKFTDAADLERQAIEYAAYAIRKTQPSALMKDLPQWFRDGTVVKLFNLFQNQINKNQNFIRDTFRGYRARKISTGTLAWRTMWNWFLPAILIGTITRGRPPEDWKELAKDIGTYYIGGWFFVGSIVNNAMQGYGGWMPAPLAFGEEFVKAYTYKTMESKFKHAISGICKVMGLPFNQPYRTINGVEDWIEGETEDVRRLIWTKYVLGEEEKVSLGKTKKIKKVKKAKKLKKKKKF